MSLRRTAFIALLPWLIIAAAATAQDAGQTMIEQAAEARRRAEEGLADFRKERLAERKKIAARLGEQYNRLDEARRELNELTRQVAELREGPGGNAEEAGSIEADATQSLSRAAAELGVSLPADATPQELEALLADRIAERVDAVQRGMKLRATTETVLARDGRTLDVPVLHVGNYAAYACGDNGTVCGILAGTASGGTPQVAGPMLSTESAESLRRVAAGSPGRIPLDLDGSLLAQAPAPPASLRAWLAKGGVFVYPILAVALLGLLIIFERLVYLQITGTRPAVTEKALSHLVRGNPQDARHAVEGTNTPAARVLRAAADASDRPVAQREAAMESALLLEAPHLERSLSLLAALAGVAPLLGLLGTVSGMVSTFNVISRTGTGNPKLLSGGISEALITTELGLIVAVPLLLVYAALRGWVHRREALLEYTAVRAFGIRDENQQEEAP